MKYSIDCPKCGQKYEVEMDFAPCFCVKCGCDMPTVEKVLPKMREKPDYEAIEAEIVALEEKIKAVDDEKSQKIATIVAVANEQKEIYRVRLRELKKKMAWNKYGSRTYKGVDHSQDMAMVLFGKRRCELTSDELREYNRICTKRSRERAKMRIEEARYEEP